VADRCGSNHTEVPFDGAAIFSRLDESLSALDQPTMDGINTYFVSWAAREVGLKVALSGLGGDELFAGYSTFSDVPRLQKLAHLAKFWPASLRRISSPLLRSLLSAAGTRDAAQKAIAVWADSTALPDLYFFARALFSPGARLEKLIKPSFRASTVGSDGVTLEPTWLGWLQRISDEAQKLPPIAGISWLEMRTYMVSTLLRDTDSVSMARSLEVRVPLLDTPLVEFVSALPDAARRRKGTQKALLVESLRDVLPPEIITQRKRTFTLPWEEWLRGPLRARLETSFASLAPALAEHLHSAGVLATWNEFLAGKTSWSRPWSLFVLNEWCHRHLST
jgi:asparagine synthase (glutamine-hydrolysing)